MENLRTSSYMIPVKLEKEEGKYMLIHGYTGAIDIVTEELLAGIKNKSIVNSFSQETLKKLLERGYLTTRSDKEEYAYVERIANALYKKSSILYSAFTWVVTYNCNFRCPYCYESREEKDSKLKIVFTHEQVDKAYDAMDEIQPRKELRANQITLYGGEPLLAENKNIVSYIVKKGVEKGYRFDAITNGYELDSFLDLLGEDKIFKLQITIDGPKDVHNQMRKHFEDNETFDRIINNIKLALDKNIYVNVRVNTDGNNIKYLSKLKKYFEDKAFFSYDKFVVYSAVMIDNSSITSLEHKSLRFLSTKHYMEEHKQYKTISFCQDYGLFNSIYNAISSKHPINLNSVFCAAQTSGYVLDPLGNIYPCWETIGQKQYLLGTYSTNGIQWNESVINLWREKTFFSKDECKYCKYFLLCRGGCPFNSINTENKNNQCSYFREILKISVNRAYNQANDDLLIIN